MNNSTRLAVSAHVLTLLAYSQPESLASEIIASSVGTGAVVIRRLLARLRRTGLVSSQSGPTGGWRLARSPEAITLRDLYRAVEGSPLFPLHDGPNPRCPVGRHVGSVLSSRFEAAHHVMESDLHRTTIADLLADVRNTP